MVISVNEASQAFEIFRQEKVSQLEKYIDDRLFQDYIPGGPPVVIKYDDYFVYLPKKLKNGELEKIIQTVEALYTRFDMGWEIERYGLKRCDMCFSRSSEKAKMLDDEQQAQLLD